MTLRKLSVPKAVFLTLAAIACPAFANESPLNQLRDSDQRVASVGWRLFTANAARCPAVGPGTGMILHSLAQYHGASREAALAIWKFPMPVSIAGVVPGSPAERAGLRAGDGIVAIAGFLIPTAHAPGSHLSALRDSAEAYLQSLPSAEKIPLMVRRQEETLPIVLAPRPACRTRLEVVASTALKARSDGSTIQVGQDFIAQLSESELAFVIAHELAHTIGQHRARLSRLESNKSSAAKRQRAVLARQFEDDADLLALDLLANAGWNPAIAPRFMRAKGNRFEPPIRLGGSHRSAGERAARMEKALSERANTHSATRAKAIEQPGPSLAPG